MGTSTYSGTAEGGQQVAAPKIAQTVPSVVLPLIRDQHYLGTVPNNSYPIFGLWEGEALVRHRP